MKTILVVLLGLCCFASYAKAINLDYELPIRADYCASLPPECAPPEPRYTLDVEWHEPATPLHVYTLVGLQLLDVATTAYAVRKYDCIVELNPLLPRRPNVGDLLLLKALPLVFVDDWHATDEELAPATFVTAVVVLNNFDVIDTARRRCSSR